MKVYLCVFLLGALNLVCVPQGNPVRKNVNVSTEVPRGIEKMKKGDWAEAINHFNRFTDTIGDRGEGLFGVRYFIITYNRGYCQLKLAIEESDETKKRALYMTASESFQLARKKLKVGSLSQIRSLLYQARAEQGAENYALAIELYKQFKREIEAMK